VPAGEYGADPQICGRGAGALPGCAEAVDEGAGLVRGAERVAIREPQVPVSAADQGR